MNREIKFRMWRDGRMQGVHTMYSKESYNEYPPKEPQNFAFSEDEILMQYTGLKDKNGKEIYEGDILRNPDSQKSDFFVKFNPGGWDAVYKGNFTLSLYPILSEHSGCEIIGNIYFNPELLKG